MRHYLSGVRTVRSHSHILVPGRPICGGQAYADTGIARPEGRTGKEAEIQVPSVAVFHLLEHIDTPKLGVSFTGGPSAL